MIEVDGARRARAGRRITTCLFTAVTCLLLLAAGACAPAAVTESPTAPPAAASLPDLAVGRLSVELETGGSCQYTSTSLGVALTVANDGRGAAGPFAVEVNGATQEVAGLAAGQTTKLWFAGYVQNGENVVVIDSRQQVAESDEGNNRVAERLPIPTLPRPCTPTPAPQAAVPATTEPPTALPATPTPTAPATAPPPTATRTQPPTAPPTPTKVNPQSRPTGVLTPSAAVAVRSGTMTLAAYPFAEFLTQGRNDALNVTYAVLDRAAYEASNPAPRPATFKTLIVENELLRLTFVPDLGGRLYEVFYKPTNHRVTYRNPVLKPTHWGPAEQGWWLAAGGIEWCLPVEEHGYEWDVPWTAETSRDARGVTVTLRDTTATDRLRAAVAVRLEAGSSAFTIRPRLENPTAGALAVKYWTNAMLAPGGRNAPSADLRFVLPDAITAVTVHSRGDEALPDYNQRLSWPAYQGTDLSRLGNWGRWLGFFEDPAAGDFMGVYDTAYDEGMVRAFPAGVARGAKVFGFGWADPISPDNWTDDTSSYVEMHGGPAPTFDDSVTLGPGEVLEWIETWYPVAGLGGLRYANTAAALDLWAGEGRVKLAVTTPHAWTGDVVLSIDGVEVWRRQVSLGPGQVMRQAVAPGGWSGRVAVRLATAGGQTTAEYQTNLAW